MTSPFVYEQLPGRTVFGPGAIASLPGELDRLGVDRALVLCTPEQRGQADAVAARIGSRCVGVYDRAAMHVPMERADEAIGEAGRLDARAMVAVGGGSTIGLGKAVALRIDLPIVAVPTTYAGSEMTPVYGLTDAGVKRTGRDPRVLPKVVLYDPELTLSLPLALSVASGLNAIAHAVEALYAKDANPVSSLLAEEAIRSMARGLRRLVAAPRDLDARADCLFAASLCGSVFATVGGGLHHKLCHVLGGSHDLPHAETHAVVLPYVTAYNAPAAPDAMRRIARALGTDDAAAGLRQLAVELGAPTSLAALGMPLSGIERAADLAMASPYWNPRPVERDDVVALLEAAHAGRGTAPLATETT